MLPHVSQHCVINISQKAVLPGLIMQDTGIVGPPGPAHPTSLFYSMARLIAYRPSNILGPGSQHAHIVQIGKAPSQIAPWEQCGWLATLPWVCRFEYIVPRLCPDQLRRPAPRPTILRTPRAIPAVVLPNHARPQFILPCNFKWRISGDFSIEHPTA